MAPWGVVAGASSLPESGLRVCPRWSHAVLGTQDSLVLPDLICLQPWPGRPRNFAVNIGGHLKHKNRLSTNHGKAPPHSDPCESKRTGGVLLPRKVVGGHCKASDGKSGAPFTDHSPCPRSLACHLHYITGCLSFPPREETEAIQPSPNHPTSNWQGWAQNQGSLVLAEQLRKYKRGS